MRTEGRKEGRRVGKGRKGGGKTARTKGSWGYLEGRKEEGEEGRKKGERDVKKGRKGGKEGRKGC